MHRGTMAVLSLALVAGAANADTLRLEQDSFSVGVGGEFKATPITGNAGLTGLAADLSADSLETFCLEYNEHFHPGSVYSFVINTGAVNGGVSGQTVPNFDPVDPMTAYLYTHFRQGDLVGFDYGAGRAGSSGDLQQAVWFIEGEGGTNNAFVALAQAAVSSGAWIGIGDVRVLNLTDADGHHAQDQLTLVRQIPGPGSGLVVAAAALGLARRRRALG